MTQPEPVENPPQAVVVAPPTSETSAILSVIERVALDPNVDIEKLERMLDMQERVLNRNAKQAFAADFVRMKPHLPRVVRTKKNEQTKSKYAPLEDINKEIDPVLERFGFGTSTKLVSQTDRAVTVKAMLWHRDGHIEENEITMPLDDRGIAGTVNKTLPHAVSSSIMYARRVATCAILNISTGDDRDGNGDPAVLDIEKAVEIDRLIGTSGADKAKFLAHMKADSVQNIRAGDYQKAKNLLNAKAKQKEAGQP